jgi:protein ImuA
MKWLTLFNPRALVEQTMNTIWAGPVQAFGGAGGFTKDETARRPALLASLRSRIARIEQVSRSDVCPWNLGVPGIDERLPPGGLASNGIHEIVSGSYPDMPAAMGFAASLAMRRLRLEEGVSGPLLWVRLDHTDDEWGRLYGHGLVRLGVPRERLLTVSLRTPQGLLWTLEEALKSRSLAIVIADAGRHAADLTVTRRLSLAARTGSTPALLVFPHGLNGGTAALTRWCIRAHPSSPPFFDADAPGHPSWSLTLERCRSGKPGMWTVEWHHATHRFSLVPLLSGGTARPSRPSHSLAGERPALRAGLAGS